MKNFTIWPNLQTKLYFYLSWEEKMVTYFYSNNIRLYFDTKNSNIKPRLIDNFHFLYDSFFQSRTFHYFECMSCFGTCKEFWIIFQIWINDISWAFTARVSIGISDSAIKITGNPRFFLPEKGPGNPFFGWISAKDFRRKTCFRREYVFFPVEILWIYMFVLYCRNCHILSHNTYWVPINTGIQWRCLYHRIDSR